MNTLDLIRTIDPCAGREPDAARMDAALDRLLAAAAQEEAAGEGAGRGRAAALRRRAPLAGFAAPTRLGGRPRRAAVAVAGLVSLAAVVVAVSGGERVAPASAATVLRHARAAASQAQGAGPWTVVVVRDYRRGGPYTIEQWSSDGGEQLTRSTAEGASPLPDPYDGKLIRRDTAGFGPTVADTRALPTDPAALAAKLGDDVVQRATMLLLSPDATPQLRAGLYGVLLRTPGAQLIPSLTDPEGRTGEGVRFVKPNPPQGTDAPGGYDMTLLFDRETHALLGVRQSTWEIVLAAHRAATAPKPDFEERAPDPRKPPVYVPVP